MNHRYHIDISNQPSLTNTIHITALSIPAISPTTTIYLTQHIYFATWNINIYISFSTRINACTLDNLGLLQYPKLSFYLSHSNNITTRTLIKYAMNADHPFTVTKQRQICINLQSLHLHLISYLTVYDESQFTRPFKEANDKHIVIIALYTST